MANEDLIYRLTKAVYGRLGAAADEQTVEQLVTELYREIEPFLGANGTSYLSSQSFPSSVGTAPQSQKALQPNGYLVFGVDLHGIVSGVAKILAGRCMLVESNCFSRDIWM